MLAAALAKKQPEAQRRMAPNADRCRTDSSETGPCDPSRRRKPPPHRHGENLFHVCGEAEIKHDLGDGVEPRCSPTRRHWKAFAFPQPPNQSVPVSHGGSRVQGFHRDHTHQVSRCTITAEAPRGILPVITDFCS